MEKLCLAKLQISFYNILKTFHNVRKNYMLIFAYYSNKAISPLFDDLQYSLFIVCLHLYKEKKNWLYVQTKL